jgi:ubiquinone/menaquinone biosynthesis C-methylase UbiE
MTEQDKLIERARYDARAESKIEEFTPLGKIPFGAQAVPPYIRTPYSYYEAKIAELINPRHRVLELGSGSGMHTSALLQTGANVVVSDISSKSLALLSQRFVSNLGKLKPVVADMENLPFESNSFDVVASAGSLSYGRPQIVDAEIRRVLRPGGMLICVDSLNHNPIYRLNRWVHYLRGNRTRSTLISMPDLTRIQELGVGFDSVDVKYFGALSFAMPMVARIVGENTAQSFSDYVDKWVGVRRSAFKFVLVYQGLN